jgi:hypothetical protein
MEPIEIYGYISMVVVIISMLMKDMKRLRIINTISCAMFLIYGLILSAYPIVLLNTAIIFINLFKLSKGE